MNKAKNIAISACHKIRRTTSENKQRVSQPYNIFYLSFIEKFMSPRRKKLLPKSRTALEYQNRSHDISKRQTSITL